MCWSEATNFNILCWFSLNILIVFNMKLYEIQNTELSLIFFNKSEEQIIEYLYASVQKNKTEK